MMSIAPARERTLPVLAAFVDLFPNGSLQRGSTIGCIGAAATSLALAVAAQPSQQGSWVSVAGLPGLGLRAAAECGVALERLVAVNDAPVCVGAGKRFSEQQWAELLAAMIDGFDVVLIGPAAQQVRSGAARQLQARAQSRGAVLVVAGTQQVFGCDLQLTANVVTWRGLGSGHGVASSRLLQVELCGRRLPRARRASMWFPGHDGRIRLETPTVGSATGDSGGDLVALRRTG